MNKSMEAAAAQPSKDVIAMVEKLISFPTISRDSNLGLIEWARDYLAAQGVSCRLTYDATGKKANLFATVGGGSRPGIILSGHTDVVPVEGQAWESDPFKAVIRNNALYGRGSADMKGFIGTVLAQVPRFLAAGLDYPVHLALSYDEEVGCLGVRELLKDLEEIGLKAAGCIVGEPTDMLPLVGHKGISQFRCRVHGREAHSSYTNLGVNAIEYAARIVVYVRELANRLAADEPRSPAFTVPYTTLQTGTITGGIAPNVVPRNCEFYFEARTTPFTDADVLYREIQEFAATLLPEMQTVEPNAKIDLERMVSTPGLSMGANKTIADFVNALAGTSSYTAASYSTEAGLFQQAGFPAVVCGPGRIEEAHRPNEHVTLAQLAKCEAFLQALMQVPEIPS